MTGKGIDFTPELRDYLVAHSTPPTPQHQAIVDATLERFADFSMMQIPAEQGSLMTMLARLIGAREAIEVGTFTGYSALSIALGLPEDGRLLCCDVSDEFTSVGRPQWDAAGVGDRIEMRIGPATETLAALADEPRFDLAFIDADKPNYHAYFELLLPRLRRGGLIVVDNVLWSGAAADPTADGSDENLAAIRDFNDRVAADDRVDVVMLNVADGLTLIRKR